MNDAAITALLRSQLYAVLARGFTEPPRALADRQADGNRGDELAAAVEALPGGEDLAAVLGEFWRHRAAVNDKRALEELRSNYMELFGNLRSERGFPPYETEYTGGANDFLKNQDLADLMGFYRAFGLDLGASDELRERPDHIAVELEFLHFLCWKEACAREEGNEEHIGICLDAEQKFLRDHLGRWAEVFARGVEKTATGGFFSALAALLRKMVTQEAAIVGVTLDPVKVPPPRRVTEAEPMACGAEASCPLQRMG